MSSINTLEYAIFLSTVSMSILSISCGLIIPDGSSPLNDPEQLLREKISRDCQSQGMVIPDRALNEYASCFSQSHMLFAYKSEDSLPDYIPGNNTGELLDNVLETFCVDWRRRTKCIADNAYFIRPCLTDQKNILMDFNIAFGNALCSNNGGELYDFYVQFVTAGGIRCMLDEKSIVQKMLNCINPVNTAIFKRNIYRVTDCMVEQLKQCQSELPMTLLQVMVDISIPFYKSRGIYKLNVNDDEFDSKQGYEYPGNSRKNMQKEVRIEKMLENCQPANVYIHIYLGIAMGLCVWTIIALSYCLFHNAMSKKENCDDYHKLKGEYPSNDV